VAARALGIQLRLFEARDLGEIEWAFEAMARERPEALIVMSDPVLAAHRARIAALAVRGRLPTVSATIEYAEAGLLMAYGPSFREPAIRAAAQVDRILKGARPADLPVEQGTTFSLVLNLTTARTLGLTIPASLAARADRVIE
jgi:putative ABC transport system substrate-binding protein